MLRVSDCIALRLRVTLDPIWVHLSIHPAPQNLVITVFKAAPGTEGIRCGSFLNYVSLPWAQLIYKTIIELDDKLACLIQSSVITSDSYRLASSI